MIPAQASLFPPALPAKGPQPRYPEASLDAIAGASRVAIDCETTGPQPMTAALTHVAFATTTRYSGFAHATEDTVKQAVKVATKPLLLSHTALSGSQAMGPTPLTGRQVSPDHARSIAGTGGA